MRIILHIGQSKTGTSAIQSFLTLNRNALIEQGFLYPTVRVMGLPVDVGSHNAVADAIEGVKRYPYKTAQEYREKFFDQAKAAGVHSMILSAEHFFAGEPRTWDIPTEDLYLQRYEEKVQHVATWLAGHKVTVIVYLRPQIPWLRSAIAQNIKTAGLISRKDVYSNDEKFFENFRPLLRYGTLLRIWRRILAPSSLEVVPYDRKSLRDGSSVADFLNRLEIASSQMSHGSVELAVNRSLTIEYLEVKKIFNRSKHSKTAERVAIKCLEQLSRNSQITTEYNLDSQVQQHVQTLAEIENEILFKEFGVSLECTRKMDCVPKITNEQIKQAHLKFIKKCREPRSKLLYFDLAARSALRQHAFPLHTLLHQAKRVARNQRFKSTQKKV